MKRTYLTRLLLLAAFFSTFNAYAYDDCRGGFVTAFGGASRVYTCPGDGKSDIIIFARSGHSENTKYQFVITDDRNNILGLPAGSRADLEGAGVGNCFVWGVAFTGELKAKAGENLFRTQFSTGCSDISRTKLVIVRDKPDGGKVKTRDNKTTINLCTRDGDRDLIFFRRTTHSNAAYVYLITDDRNNILAIQNSSHNFEGAPRGNCRVWGLSYTGLLMAQVGQNAATATLASSCWDLSDNYINVIRADVDGGEVKTADGKTRVLTVPGDGIADIIKATHTTASSAPFRYIVTDDKNKVLGLPPGNMVDVEGAGPGLCRIWGVSYTGTLTVKVGDVLGKKDLSDGCFDLSKNFIETVRNSVDGGTVAMPNGLTTRYTCPGDGKADIVRFVNTSITPAAQYRYIVTDDRNTILALPPANEANLEGAGTGVCRIWGVSFLGNFTAQVGQNAATAGLASGMFDLSDNFITVNRDKPIGGYVSMPDGQTVRYSCPGDNRPDIVRFRTTSTSNTRYQFVVTDDRNIILALPPANEANLEGAGVGVCRIWGVAYTGTFTGKPGDDAARVALSDDCFSLSSNFITANRFQPNGGKVMTYYGESAVTVTVGDGKPDYISFKVKDNSKSRFAWVVTDDKNVILGLPNGFTVNFEDAGVGICRVWGLSYTGQLTALPGDNAATTPLSTECFDLSDNYVTINRVTHYAPPPIAETRGLTTKTSQSIVSPNPTKDKLNILFSDKIDFQAPINIQVINTLGAIVLNQNTNGSQANLDLNTLNSGVYFVKLVQGPYVETHKILKQ